MLLPTVLPWVEETDNHMARGIITADMRGLVKITSTAGQRPIRGSIFAASGNRHNMFDF
jgi:hypothetical protein